MILCIALSIIGLILSIISIFLILSPKLATEKVLLIFGRWNDSDGDPMNPWAVEFDRRNK